MKKAEAKSPTRGDGATARRESAVGGPNPGATNRPASSFILHPSSFTSIPWWLLAVLLGLVTMALYWPATRCDFLVVDALDLTANPHVLKGLSWDSIKWSVWTPGDII